MEVMKFQAISFVPFGLMSTICNAILIAAILRNRKLRVRQELKIIAAQSFADLVEALATLLGGLYRLIIIVADLKGIEFSGFQCMLLPHSWMWRWSDFATSFMLLVVTFDRILSVAVPVEYFAFNNTYPFVAISTPYFLSTFLSMFAWYYPITMTEKLSILCLNVYLSPKFYSLSKYLTSFATALSILLYIPVIILARRQMKAMRKKISETQIDHRRRIQLRMTLTIAFSSCCTFFLDCVPRAIGIYGTTKLMAEENIQCESVMTMLFHLTKLNSIIAFFLFYCRNELIKQTVNSMFNLNHASNYYFFVICFN
ncbi:unnamed protein product [Dracunculus medinensis]|uniref:G_PROTEIN_RECEP_F1_2 domain-containing protein n=1 Tax=Dracunculus medinensis TaxID=318479 RepID=A0A0N4UI42_DRAME|nr:unnamed protein product [Dracunculus medinensis]